MRFSFNPHNHPGRKGASSPFILQKAEPPLAKRTAEPLVSYWMSIRVLHSFNKRVPGWPSLGPGHIADAPWSPTSVAHSSDASTAGGAAGPGQAPPPAAALPTSSVKTSLTTWGPLCTHTPRWQRAPWLGRSYHLQARQTSSWEFLETSPPLRVDTPQDLPLLRPPLSWTPARGRTLMGGTSQLSPDPSLPPPSARLLPSPPTLRLSQVPSLPGQPRPPTTQESLSICDSYSLLLFLKPDAGPVHLLGHQPSLVCLQEWGTHLLVRRLIPLFECFGASSSSP